MSSLPSYGYAYLTSYGWAGTGTALRDGAVEKPLAIPQKKSLSGLGRDRDDAFPFWDHLFAAASKAITIKISSDDEDADADEDPPSHTDSCAPLRRTATGILSNRRPISGTPATTSGSTTPSLVADADTTPVAGTTGRLSLLATARREAAKRSLYARFFRGPVLGPDGDASTSRLASVSCASSATSIPILGHASDRQDVGIGEAKKSVKWRVEDRIETKEERRERKRLKRERKIARAAEKAEKATAQDMAKRKRDRLSRKARMRQPGRDEMTPYSKRAHEHARKSAKGSAKDGSGQVECTQRGLEAELPSTNNEQQSTLHGNEDATNASNVVLTYKRKRKRKDIPS